LQRLLLDRVDHCDDSALSWTVALGRKPQLLSDHRLDRRKTQQLVSVPQRDFPVAFLQDQSL
jgi:hypothetical protein